MNKNLIEEPVVCVKNLVSGFGNERILDSISFSLNKGLIHAIIGTSGCGKTTLLKNILGLMKYRSGSVNVLGAEMNNSTQISLHKVRERTGVLFQRGALLNSMTVAENVALPFLLHRELELDKVRTEVEQLLVEVGLENAGNKMPTELSGGMVKRAALARALAIKPEILFCDEPSAGLDPVTTRGIDELLLTLRKETGMTIVLITHDLDSIRRIADRVLFMNDRKILFHGTADDAINSELPPIKAFFTRTSSC